MARLPRIVVSGQPLHIIQRGNNRGPCFFADEDYRFYRDSLKDASSRYRGDRKSEVFRDHYKSISD